MKTSGMTEVLPLDRKQKYACNIVMGVLLVAAGVILILAGTNVIKASVRLIAAPTILFAFGTAVFVSAVIGRNALSAWIAGVTLACGLPSLIVAVAPVGYAELYPIYIASPAIGCAFSIAFAEAKLPQIKGMAFFGVLAGIFALQSSGACGWGVVGGLLAAFVGACIVLYSIGVYLRKDNDDA